MWEEVEQQQWECRECGVWWWCVGPEYPTTCPECGSHNTSGVDEEERDDWADGDEQSPSE